MSKIIGSLLVIIFQEMVMISLAFSLGRITQFLLNDPLVRKIVISSLIILLNSKK